MPETRANNQKGVSGLIVSSNTHSYTNKNCRRQRKTHIYALSSERYQRAILDIDNKLWRVIEKMWAEITGGHVNKKNRVGTYKTQEKEKRERKEMPGDI